MNLQYSDSGTCKETIRDNTTRIKHCLEISDLLCNTVENAIDKKSTDVSNNRNAGRFCSFSIDSILCRKNDSRMDCTKQDQNKLINVTPAANASNSILVKRKHNSDNSFKYNNNMQFGPGNLWKTFNCPGSIHRKAM